ncbi:MAG: helical backbone metal receptor [Flavobacteriales bacterium]
MKFREVQDQMGRWLKVPEQPQRIISLVPSQTELLCDLGLDDRVVGITKFCIHPDKWFRTKTRIGGTKKINFEKIRALEPDLIIGNKEENSQTDIERLSAEYPVWISDIITIDDALDMIQAIGNLVNQHAKSSNLVSKIKFELQDQIFKTKPRVLYLIWKDPFMVAGKATFINHMIEVAGFQNAIKEDDSRYIELNDQEIKHINPDYLFLSSEPFPFKGIHLDQMKEQFPTTAIVDVDGEMFSWYGTRLLQAPRYFSALRDRVKYVRGGH